MTSTRLRTLIELIDSLVREDGPYKDKMKQILEEASEDELISISEFSGWWEPSE